jgi:hypothetical protein
LIKHKFYDNYQVVLAFNESNSSSEDVCLKALELYKSKHSKKMFFCVHSLFVDPQGYTLVGRN